MPEFNILTPPKPVTDPLHYGKEKGPDGIERQKVPLSTVFPRHVHRYKAPDKGEVYTSGEYLIVHTDEALAAALADGWSLTPVLTPPGAGPVAEDADHDRAPTRAPHTTKAKK